MSIPHKPTLLIVDDSRIVRVTLKKHLIEHYEVIEQGDGADAWQFLQNADNASKITAIISDISMPNMDGFALLKHIREAKEPLGHIPFVIVSGDEDEEKHALSAGANGFLSKSADKATMISTLASVLEGARKPSTQAASSPAPQPEPIDRENTTRLLTLAHLAWQWAQASAQGKTLHYLRLDTKTIPTASVDYALNLAGRVLQAQLGQHCPLVALGDGTYAWLGDQHFAVAMSQLTMYHQGKAVANAWQHGQTLVTNQSLDDALAAVKQSAKAIQKVA